MSSEVSALESALEFLLLQDNWYLKNTCGISLPCHSGAASVLQLAKERGWKPEPSTPAAKAGDGWIRCSERMPEKREMVLFLHPDGLGRGCGFHNGTIWQDMLDPYAQGFQEYEVADVEQWQPMPAPPSPETNGG